jgi:hypothetical protein
MLKTRRTIALIGVLLSLLGLAACIAATPTISPTADVNLLRTEVAATVFAQVAQDLALTPSATSSPAPTATVPPTPTPTQAPAELSPEPVVTTATPSEATPEEGYGNKAEWVSQSVADKTTFAPGETFTMTWTLKNTGTTTWTPDYFFRFYSGDPFGQSREVLLGQEVLTGDTVDINLEMRTPATQGTYTSVWVMSTANRSNFKDPVYLEIVVALPRTNTPAP